MSDAYAGAEVQEQVKYLATVRYGELRHISTFETMMSDLRPNEKVVVRSERGTELGTHLGQPVVLEPGTPLPEYRGRILRRMNDRDVNELLSIQDRYQPSALKFCKEKVSEQNMPMKLVSAEMLLGGEKLIFYFQSEGRVDFRRLVKDLAQEFKTRIEMRQIGARDEARILGDYGPCGRELCCKGHLTELQAVSMKMAKVQTTTLDTNKITGRCGRLKCCLRYEDETYTEMRKTLPKLRTRVHTRKGKGEVSSVDILAQQVVVFLAIGERVRMPLADVLGPLTEEEVREERAREEAAALRASERMARQDAKSARRQEGIRRPRGPESPLGPEARRSGEAGTGELATAESAGPEPGPGGPLSLDSAGKEAVSGPAGGAGADHDPPGDGERKALE